MGSSLDETTENYQRRRNRLHTDLRDAPDSYGDGYHNSARQGFTNPYMPDDTRSDLNRAIEHSTSRPTRIIPLTLILMTSRMDSALPNHLKVQLTYRQQSCMQTRPPVSSSSGLITLQSLSISTTPSTPTEQSIARETNLKNRNSEINSKKLHLCD